MSETQQNSSDYEYRIYETGDETQIVKVLSACLSGWNDNDETRWRWKHAKCPGFTPQNVIMAHRNGEMVACFHGAVLPIQLEEGLEILASFDGDFAVLPEHRRKGIPDHAHGISDRRLLEQGVHLRGGFTTRELNERFYHKRFGYVFIPSVTTYYRKPLNLMLYRQRIEETGSRLLARRAGLRHRLDRKPLVININVKEFPPCHVELTSQGFRLNNGRADDADLRIELPYRVLAAARTGTGSLLRSVLINFFLGRLRFKGVLRNMPTLVALCWAAGLDK